MTVFADILARHDNVVDAACELGRGLMRGERDSLKLGYTAANATLAAARAYEVPDDGLPLVRAHLHGFGDGLRRAARSASWRTLLHELPDSDPAAMEARYDAGAALGRDEDLTRCHPATI